MADVPTLQHQIAILFEREMHLDVPTPDTDLFEAGILDSLAFVDLVLHLERTFGVTIAIESLELDHFRSITAMAGFLGRHRNGNGNHP